MSGRATTRSEFKVTSTSGSTLACVLNEPTASAVVADSALGVLVLVHSSPLGNRGSLPLPQLSTLLSAPTIRFDLTGCGASTGEPSVGAFARDAADIRAVVLYVQEKLGKKVLGLVGYALGGTAVLQYAAVHNDVQFIVAISTHITLANAFSSSLTWSQLEEIKKKGEIEVPLKVCHSLPLLLSVRALTEQHNRTPVRIVLPLHARMSSVAILSSGSPHLFSSHALTYRDLADAPMWTFSHFMAHRRCLASPSSTAHAVYPRWAAPPL